MDSSNVHADSAAQCKAVTAGLCEGAVPSPFRYDKLKTCSKAVMLSCTVWNVFQKREKNLNVSDSWVVC